MALIIKDGIAWRVERDVDGLSVREVSASPGECADEIDRLQQFLAVPERWAGLAIDLGSEQGRAKVRLLCRDMENLCGQHPLIATCRAALSEGDELRKQHRAALLAAESFERHAARADR